MRTCGSMPPAPPRRMPACRRGPTRRPRRPRPPARPSTGQCWPACRSFPPAPGTGPLPAGRQGNAVGVPLFLAPLPSGAHPSYGAGSGSAAHGTFPPPPRRRAAAFRRASRPSSRMPARSLPPPPPIPWLPGDGPCESTALGYRALPPPSLPCRRRALPPPSLPCRRRAASAAAA